MIDSCPLLLRVVFLDTLSIGPDAGNQDTPAGTESDSLVSGTTPCALVSRELPDGVLVAKYGIVV